MYRIGQRRHDDGDDTTAVGGERTGHQVRHVADLKDRRRDARGGLGADLGGGTEEARDGLRRNSGSARHILNADATGATGAAGDRASFHLPTVGVEREGVKCLASKPRE